MPVILREAEEEKWLDPSLTEKEIKSMMRPFPDDLMIAKQLPLDYFKR